MKIVSTKKLTPAHLRRLDLYIYLAIAFAVLFVSLSLFWMIFRLGGQEDTILFADAAYAFTALVGALWVGQTVYRGRRGILRLEPRHQLSWLLIGVGLLFSSLGGTYYTYLEYIHQSPFPSLSDIGFTLFYPFVFIGLLLMPTNLRFRTRMGLDTLITTLSFVGISWFFVIGPLYFASVKQATSLSDLLSLIVGLSYPCWDIVLILAIVILIQRRTERVLHPSLILFALGILATVWADTGYAYTNIFTQNYVTGTPSIDTFWLIGFLMIGLSALSQYNTLVRKVYREQVQTPQLVPASSSLSPPLVPGKTVSRDRTWSRLENLLIYVPFTFLLVLTVYSEIFNDDQRSHYLIIFTAIIGVLVTVRYLLATRENEVLLQERAREHTVSEHLRHINTQLTEVLDIESLLERVVEMATRELGFDAAMLILLEEQGPISPRSHFLVNTASLYTPKTKWRLQGDTFFYSRVLCKEEVEIRWNTLTQDVPPEIYTWQQEQGIAMMQFFPLTYQDTLLGCLGVSRLGSNPLGQQDVTLARTYTVQVTTIIEHALLYKEARDHETFARAMASIAARLNAAVIEPAEIHQLICTEGASALQADYVVLYIVGEQGALEPGAAYATTSEVSSLYKEWPIIQPHDPEAEALSNLQPTLYHVRPPHSTTPLPALDISARNSGVYPVPARMREQRRQNALSLNDKLAWHNVHTAILAPLTTVGDPVGMLVLGRSVPLGTRDKQSFGIDSLSLAQDFAEQASVAFMNAHLYQHLRDAHQQLQELDQLKDQFMITASHELRTPLTAVQGYIELMAQYDDILPLHQRQEFIQKARRSCEELVVLLSNVMDASRLEAEAGIRPVQMEGVDVWEVIESVINIIGPQVEQEQRQVHVRIPKRISVLADPVRLRQILMNISVNALKYSPARTPILYSAHVMNTRVPSVTISITDKGNGIAPQDQARLFQRFVRLESDVNSPIRGSGLGLYISRRLTEAMGGKIWIESNGIAGEGSTFHLQLPMA